jgi:hypothetical protein
MGFRNHFKGKEHITKAAGRVEHSPEHFPLFIDKKNVRRCVASPQTSIFLK